MGFLAKIFGAVSAEEMDGIRLEGPEFWEVSEADDMAAFFRALPVLLPKDAILYLEGVHSRDVVAYLEYRPAKRTSKVAFGTIWPRPNSFHLEASEANLEGLAKLSESHAQREVCIHLHCYREGRVLLEWHDAFSQEMLVSISIPQERVGQFCERLNCKYQRERLP